MHGPCRTRWLSRLGDSLKELLWPLGRFCILCGVATRSQSLCPQCLANLRACALPVAHQHPGMTAADGLCAAFAYEDAAKRLVWELKFGAWEEAGVVLGRPWSEKNVPPESGANLYRKDLGQNPGDAMIRYDGSTLTIKCTGAINIEAGGAVTINGATIDLN